MSYNPNETSARDVIRGMAGDTDTAAEWLPDATYDAILLRHGSPVSEWSSSPKFLRAAAESLRRVAIAIENDPSSYTATGDFSVSWADRTRSLRLMADDLERQAGDIEADEAGGLGFVTVTNRFLSGGGNGYEW